MREFKLMRYFIIDPLTPALSLRERGTPNSLLVTLTS